MIGQKATPEKKARRRAFMHPRYLGAHKGLVWLLLGFKFGVFKLEPPRIYGWERRSAWRQPLLPPDASVEEICEAYARVFCGLDERYCPIRGWTGTKEAAQFLLHDAFVRPDLPDEAEPLVVLKAYFRALAQLFLKVEAAWEGGEISGDVYWLIGKSLTAHVLLDLRGKHPRRGFLLPDEPWFLKASDREWMGGQQFFVRENIPGLQSFSFPLVENEEVKNRLSRGFTDECAATMGGRKGPYWSESLTDTCLDLAEKYASVFMGTDGTFATPCGERGKKLAETLVQKTLVKLESPVEGSPYEVLTQYFLEQARAFYEALERYTFERMSEEEFKSYTRHLQQKIVEEIAENF